MELATTGGYAHTRDSCAVLRPSSVRDGLLVAISALMSQRGPARSHPAPLSIAPGEALAVVRTPDAEGQRTHDALERAVAPVEVITLETEAGRESGADHAHEKQIKLVVATHHSVALAAQHHALTWDVPVLLPGFLGTTGQVRLWLRPDPALVIMTADGDTSFAVESLHLRARAGYRQNSTAERAIDELLLRPTGGGALTATRDESGSKAQVLRQPQLVHLPEDTLGTVDGEERAFPRGTYRISAARRGLYRIHIEQSHPDAGRLRP
jgi:hypothetical protein